MIMKNANYFQSDHKVNILNKDGVEIMESKFAWEKYKWCRKYFSKKPKEGYFVWVRKQIDTPMLSCVSILSKGVKQKMSNLVIIEKNLNIKMHGTCRSSKGNICGGHHAHGKLILKENSSLEYTHTHSWGQKDVVDTDYEYVLEKNSKLNYVYKEMT